MFICKHCKEEKDDSLLVKGYLSRCKRCHKDIRAEWARNDRLKNPAKYRDRMRSFRDKNPDYVVRSKQKSNDYNAAHRSERLAYQKQRQAERQEFINSFKNKPCTDCGKTFPNFCMDFDHVKGEKLDNLSSMKSNRTLERIQAEIEKCELVCAICHRIRTQSRLE
jgi:hypothetical protein